MYEHEIKYELRMIWYAIIFILFSVMSLSVILLINTLSDVTKLKPVKAEIPPVRGENDLCGLDVVVCPNEPVESKKATVFAYVAIPELTDSSPCITASGLNVCNDFKPIVANNCLKFGTKVKIQGKIYEVQDRMNERYTCKDFDILMQDYEEAKQWGVKEIEVLIYG